MEIWKFKISILTLNIKMSLSPPLKLLSLDKQTISGAFNIPHLSFEISKIISKYYLKKFDKLRPYLSIVFRFIVSPSALKLLQL